MRWFTTLTLSSIYHLSIIYPPTIINILLSHHHLSSMIIYHHHRNHHHHHQHHINVLILSYSLFTDYVFVMVMTTLLFFVLFSPKYFFTVPHAWLLLNWRIFLSLSLIAWKVLILTYY
jgi:hypothetical protein